MKGLNRTQVNSIICPNSPEVVLFPLVARLGIRVGAWEDCAVERLGRADGFSVLAGIFGAFVFRGERGITGAADKCLGGDLAPNGFSFCKNNIAKINNQGLSKIEKRVCSFINHYI